MKATFEEEKKKPLMIEIETARRMIIKAVNQAREECSIPVFIMEGIISDIHQQLSSESKITLLNDMSRYLNDIENSKDKEIERLRQLLDEKNNDIIMNNNEEDEKEGD
ncbi:hypothetical protein [Anaerococcus tetradius]|uniref:Uncharacterized protein n=1 Tax=Anaerococcus tetradius TaxID=33036 RepID=A0A133KDJ8_9FIRM|nr:hypothetical protein [Anaerococcus tetradius]KWZ77567.1 hypothetical protein HMPREF3200_01388 [Anaerococcus tetradius]